MIQSLADHIHKNAPAWLVSILVAGFAFAGSSAWFAFNIYTDIQLLKCKVGVTEGNARCQWTSTLAEDIAKETGDAAETD